MPDTSGDWRAQRTEAAAHQHRQLLRRQEQEAATARELIAGFVAAARARGLEPQPLRARAMSGSGSYRTRLVGWYLKQNQSVAVDTEGKFYVLTVPKSLGAVFRGADPTPSDPPLVLGAGGRDGESIDLTQALAAILDRARSA